MTLWIQSEKLDGKWFDVIVFGSERLSHRRLFVVVDKEGNVLFLDGETMDTRLSSLSLSDAAEQHLMVMEPDNLLNSYRLRFDKQIGDGKGIELIFESKEECLAMRQLILQYTDTTKPNEDGMKM